MSKEIYTVAWVMAEDAIIKLKEPNKTYDVDDKVDAFLKKAELYDKLDGKKVEVEINEAEGENGTITNLKLSDEKTTAKVEEPKPEEQKAHETNTGGDAVDVEVYTREIVVGGVSVPNKGVVSEEDKVWYTLDSTIQPQAFKDECTKKKVEISVMKTEKGNDVIKSYVVKEEKEEQAVEKEEPKEEKMTNKDAFYRVKELERQVRYLKEQQEKSFEAQSAVNSANQAISGMGTIHDDSNKVLKALEELAKKNYQIIQELKKG